jgi:polyisoprenoid-binding protein YceI
MSFPNADKFNTVTFKSAKFVQSGETLKVTGDLTFLGLTRPVRLFGSVVNSLESTRSWARACELSSHRPGQTLRPGHDRHAVLPRR